ncbi:hypothetical protein LCGC14_2197800, partial [marine sediment metagenome]
MAHDTLPKPKPEFDVVLLTHNKIDVTIGCLDALYQNTSKPFNLIVIDDSTDLTPQYFDTFCKDHDNVDYVHTEVKSGNHAFDIGARRALSDYVVIMTNSSRVEPEWERDPLAYLNNDGRIGLIGIKLLYPNGLIWHAGIGFANSIPTHIGRSEPGHRYTHVRPVQAVNFSVGFFRKEVLLKSLTFDEYIPFRSFDDTDVCLTIREMGWEIVYCGTSTAYHIESPTRLQGDRMKVWKEYNENLRR